MKSKNRILPFQGWRLTFFQAVMFAVFLIFSIRLYEFQIVRQDDFQARADENRFNELPIAAPRGIIIDRYGRSLAINVPAYNVTITPALLPTDPDAELQIFNRISALTGIPPTAAIARASNSNIRSIEELVLEGQGIAPFRPVIVAQDIDFHVMLQINEELITMPGVAIQVISVREYPTADLTAHIIGYLVPIPAEDAQELIEQGYNPAFDRIGWEGIERFLETRLAGVRGVIRREIDVAGETINILEEVPPTPGLSVRLTIDTELQEAATNALRNRIALVNSNAGRVETQQGVVIAMNPQTGEILAMVSYPSYDNSRFARTIDVEYYLDIIEDPLRPLVNSAIKSLYPPGSVWKLITAAGVLEENVIAPQTQLFDGGELFLENRYAPNDPAARQRFVCWLPGGHNLVNMIQGIAWSCDIYFYQIGGGNPAVSPQTLRNGGLGITDLFRYATAVGIGSELGVELPFENPGRMPDPDWKRRVYGESWSTGDTYNAAFGQGYVTVTPLQLLASTAALINGGTLYQPTVIRELTDAEGQVVLPFQPHVMRTVNLENAEADGTLTLLLIEDMIMRGPDSLACTCEPDSEWYNPVRCGNPEDYRGTVDIDPDPFTEDRRPYRVHIPLNYAFNGGVCEPLRFQTSLRPYTPAFISTPSLELVREGMRAAVTIEGGTANSANLPYVAVGGKTGTAEYCDDIARPLGLCVPGNWPSHAWFLAYAPHEDPEIIIIAFVYNGGEGSQVALPIVVETMEAYFRLRNERGEADRTITPPTGGE